jgi:CBS domain-containing protein
MSTDQRVEDALEAVKYRVYPDTPVSEVIDLMVRRGARAIPVVGEQYEVLGIITAGDALREVLRDGSPEESGAEVGHGPRLARDVMTRAVLCVSETQLLADAARMMANRKVEQLPVVRDGELIGLITRDAILHAMHGESDDTNEKREDA